MNSSTKTVCLLPGDGIGPEVVEAAVAVMETVANLHNVTLQFQEHAFGGQAIDQFGTPLPPQTLAACVQADGILMGAIGGAKWDGLSGEHRPEAGLLSLRKELGVFANLRPVVVPESLAHLSVLPPQKVAGTNVLVVRELIGGIYFGQPRVLAADHAVDTMTYTVHEIERITRVACTWAERRNGKVTSVDKANVLAVSRLWRETASRIAKNEFPNVQMDHMYVDNAAMQLALQPRQFDVILTGNLFGDILSDLASTLAGSLGLLPSACLGGLTPLFEPVHGSAPDIAGQNKANPVAAFLSAAMMFQEWSMPALAAHITSSVATVLQDGNLTADLVPPGEAFIQTTAFTQLVLNAVTSQKLPVARDAE